MGNICGKTEPDGFSRPGRVLGSAPPPAPKTAPIPRKVVGGPPRTLGGSVTATAATAAGDSQTPDEARRKAAEAAEARAKASHKGGKLQAQLSAQKKQTRNSTLAEASNQEVRARDADEAAKARNWD